MADTADSDTNTHTETPDTDGHSDAYYFELFWQTMRTLRGPYGCPWDREQTSDSIKGNLVEEAYECYDSISRGDSDAFREEIGDVFLVALLMVCIEEDSGSFTLGDVLRQANEKLVRRHPHVFGDAVIDDTAAAVRRQWDDIKANLEGRERNESVLDGVPDATPPLERAARLQKKAAKAGFDWPDIAGAREKLDEELSEFDAALSSDDSASDDSASIEREIGDLLFSVVNLARKSGVDAGYALHSANRRFSDRFKHMEKRMRERGEALSSENLDTMEELWQEAKRSS